MNKNRLVAVFCLDCKHEDKSAIHQDDKWYCVVCSSTNLATQIRNDDTKKIIIPRGKE